MKISLSVVLAVITTILCAVALVSSVRLPVSSLWRGYSVVCVPVEVEESLVLDVLGEAGIRDVISLSSQRVPLASAYAPVQSISGAEYSYLQQRRNYFFDRSQTMQLFYIPSKSMERARGAVNTIKGLSGGEGAGMEGISAYPWFVPLVVAIVCLLLALLAKFRGLMLVAGFFPLMFACCFPSYSSAGAAILLTYSLYLCNVLWRRRDLLEAIRKNRLILLFGLSGIPVSFTGSCQEGILFVVTMVAAMCLCYLLSRLELRMRRFSPVPVRSARLVSILSSVASFTLFIPAVAAATLSVSLFFFGYFPADTSINGLFLPAPARYTDIMSFDSASFQDNGQQEYFGVELPSLVHYVDWVWDTLTYPYRSLHEAPAMDLVSAGETVLLPSFEMTDKGVIQEKYTPVYSLDDSFIESAIGGILEEGRQIERVLKAQNCFTPVVYRRMGDLLDGESRGQPLVVLSLLATTLISLTAGIYTWRIQK